MEQRPLHEQASFQFAAFTCPTFTPNVFQEPASAEDAFPTAKGVQSLLSAVGSSVTAGYITASADLIHSIPSPSLAGKGRDAMPEDRDLQYLYNDRDLFGLVISLRNPNYVELNMYRTSSFCADDECSGAMDHTHFRQPSRPSCRRCKFICPPGLCLSWPSVTRTYTLTIRRLEWMMWLTVSIA